MLKNPLQVTCDPTSFLMMVVLLYCYMRIVFYQVSSVWNVQMLTSPPILKLLDSQGYLWLSYGPNGVNKTNGVNIFFFQKNTLCHSYRISVIPVIPSGLLSFLPNYSENYKY